MDFINGESLLALCAKENKKISEVMLEREITLGETTKEEVYNGLLTWTNKYDEECYNLITKYEDYTKEVLNIEREQKKPRKDYEKFSDVKGQVWYMYDDIYELKEKEYEWKNITDEEEIRNIDVMSLKDSLSGACFHGRVWVG